MKKINYQNIRAKKEIVFNWECHVIGTCEMWGARGGNVFPLPTHKEYFKILSK
jgi:hypothetical protein